MSTEEIMLRWNNTTTCVAIVLALIAAPASSLAQVAVHVAAKDRLPQIECPLRKAGIDPTKLKPFEEAEKYIQFLERPDRAEWQKPDEVVAALRLKGSETAVDLGAGSGYFTFRLAKALPKGKVVAIDSQPEMIRHIQHKAISEGVSNVESQIAAVSDPGVPANADLVFVCDVLHHVPNRSQWLKKLHAEMPAGARLAIIEFKSGELPQGPPESIKVSKAELIALLKTAGFTLREDRPRLLPYQEFLVFVKS
jgi:SAM-dependent methyltransferase